MDLDWFHGVSFGFMVVGGLYLALKPEVMVRFMEFSAGPVCVQMVIGGLLLVVGFMGFNRKF